MSSAPVFARVVRRCGGVMSALPHRRRSLHRFPCGFAAAPPQLLSHLPALTCACRHLSQQGGRWVDKLRYGAEDAPSLGSWENAYEDNAMTTRKLYCKALVHASGGSRLARDWIAGCAALTSPDPSLIYTALQHTASEKDVEELREHFLRRLLAEEEEKEEGGDEKGVGRWHREGNSRRTSNIEGGDDDDGNGIHGVRPASASATTASYARVEKEEETEREVLRAGEEVDRAATSPSSQEEQQQQRTSRASTRTSTSAAAAGGVRSAAGDDGDGVEVDATEEGSCTPEEVRAAEHLLLRRCPEVRCFMYDAMTASLFHSNYDLRTVELARRHTFWIGTDVFGIALEELTLLWRVVEAELLLKKEKIKVLGQPWSE